MKKIDFCEWLMVKKNYGERSSRDVESRLNRAKLLLGKGINSNSISNLESDESFRNLSCSVKSQIRKSIRLFLEYKGEKND